MISISHDEKADSEWNKDTPEKGIKRWVFIISIDHSGCGYHKNSEVSPGGRQKRQKISEFGPISEFWGQYRPDDTDVKAQP